MIPLLLALVQDVVVTGPAKANAQTPATLVIEPAAMLVVACDADGDGATTRNELDQCLARSFPADGARYIAYGDWAGKWLGHQNALPSPEECDKDMDGSISLEELTRQFSRLFSRYDRDGDGRVTRPEALTIRAVAADANGPRPAPAPPGKRRRR